MHRTDEIDEHILRVLGEDGKITNRALAERVGLSPSACLRRVQELERVGVIKGYRAVIDATKLGIGFVAYLAVGLSEHSSKAQRDFERAIVKSDVVKECHNIAGAVEYILRVEVPGLAEYKAFHTGILGNVPHVSSISSYVVMASPKDLRA